MKFFRPLHALRAASLMVALTAGSGLALAHAMVETSEPAEGAVLSTTPRQVVLRFNEPSRVTALRLLNEAGQEMGVRRDASRGTATSATAAVTGPLAPGGYRVEWRAMGADGHVMSGTVHFTVASR